MSRNCVMWDTYNVLAKGQFFKEVSYIHTGMGFMKCVKRKTKQHISNKCFIHTLKAYNVFLVLFHIGMKAEVVQNSFTFHVTHLFINYIFYHLKCNI